MILEYQLLEDGNGFKGIAPRKMTKGSVGYDLYLPRTTPIFPGTIVAVSLLIAFDVPEPYYLEIFPRSSLQTKYAVSAATAIIDTDYKKSIHAILHNTSGEKVTLKEGMRILQFVVKKKEDVEIRESVVFDTTGRGGLGSTDK